MMNVAKIPTLATQMLIAKTLTVHIHVSVEVVLLAMVKYAQVYLTCGF